MKITRTQAIRRFLKMETHPDLATMYTHDMECQVNVARDCGEPIDGEYRGKKWQGYTDGLTTWKSFRIPYKANSTPEYNDVDMAFDLVAHVEAIGMTGWDWNNRVSKWVGYDFDAIVGHSDAHNKKLTDQELQQVVDAAKQIPWVTIRKSTSGSGLHLYVRLDDIYTANHNEHAALGRAVLGTMSGLIGFDFCSKVDICGGNMWVWHRKMRNTDGLELIKKGEIFRNVPPNWRDHIKVVKGSRKKNMPKDIEERSMAAPFDTLVSTKIRVPLDEEHKTHIAWLKDNKDCIWWWDSDHHMLVTHTSHLEAMHRDLSMHGIFNTISTKSSAQNCFCFPVKDGGWAVRRYSLGVNEHPSWEQDGSGWTRCYLNRLPTLATACRYYNGVEDTNGEFAFQRAEDAVHACVLMKINVQVGVKFNGRPAWIKRHKDGRLIISLKREPADVLDTASLITDWLPKDKRFQKILSAYAVKHSETETMDCDSLMRHLVDVNSKNAGWILRSNNSWHDEPRENIKLVLQSNGFKSFELTDALGAAILNPWKLTNEPFQPEYPGNRYWNRDGAKLKYTPSDPTGVLNYPTWSKVLNHCGEGLDSAVKKDAWCTLNGIKTGGEYLKCWVASLFKVPEKHLPYLFFYSKAENTGKSSFHEALSLLLTRGYVRAENALTNQQGFNSELDGSIICVTEELDISKGLAHNRIKAHVTSREISIHPKGGTPYHQINTTHWIQCANDHSYCPIFKGDTRITMICVPAIDPMDMIPEAKLRDLLEKEAPDFLADILAMDLPESNDRLNVPVVESADKAYVQSCNMSELEIFIAEKCEPCDCNAIRVSEFYDRFVCWLDAGEANWSKHKVGKSLPPENPKGRLRSNGQFHIGNLRWRNDDTVAADDEFVYTQSSDNYLQKTKKR